MSDPAGQENEEVTTTTAERPAEGAQKLEDLLEEAALSGERPTELIHVESRTGKGFLTIDPNQEEWTPAQLVALKSIDIETQGPDAIPMPYVLQFLYVCQMRDLDPWLREAYLITHSKRVKRGGQWVDEPSYTLVVGIDGFRKRGEDTGEYRGQVGPEWCGEDLVWKQGWNPKWGNPTMARVGIMRAGHDVPTYGYAAFDEFCPMVPVYEGYGENRHKTNRMQPSPMWQKMGSNQIAKCFSGDTEVLTSNGFKLFADVTAADYIMQVTENGIEPTAARPFVQRYDGPMVTLDSDDLNFSVTPNHDMVTTFGKVEAGAMYATTGSPKRAHGWRIPRVVAGSTPDTDIASDRTLMVAAAVMADGWKRGDNWVVKVSRQAKIDRLIEFDLHDDRILHRTRGTEAIGRSGRIVRTNFDQVAFIYRGQSLAGLLDDDKQLHPEVPGALSARQARLIVDTLIEFDGSTNKTTGVRRFYTSNPQHRAMFDVLAVKAGYAISGWTARESDLSDRPNWYVTVSDRDAIPVYRWGRDHGALSKGNAAGRTGLTLTENTSGEVWCVTVPSHVIVVRRNGFSMLCGQCAEAQGWRKAFPRKFSGIYEPAEMERAAAEHKQQQADKAREEGAERRMAAWAAEQARNAEAATVVDAEIVDDQEGPREPVSARQAVQEAAAQMQAQRTPRQPPATDEQRLAWLVEEVRFLERIIGHSIELLAKRQIEKEGKPIQQFTANQLQLAVNPLRQTGVMKLRQAGRDDEAAAYSKALPGVAAPLWMLLGLPEPAPAPAAEQQPVDAKAQHVYVDNGGVCGVEGCEQFEDDVVHAQSS